MKSMVLFCLILVYPCNGQDCTSPVYSNFGVTISGPCPSSQVIAPVGSIIKFECCYSYTTGNYHIVWNITKIGIIIDTNSPNNSNITIKINTGNRFTTLTRPITQHEQFYVQCGLCNGIKCHLTPLQVTVISLPVQLISFGKLVL